MEFKAKLCPLYPVSLDRDGVLRGTLHENGQSFALNSYITAKTGKASL
jgi:hypothetical protein